MSDIEKMGSDEIGIIVAAHKEYLDSGKPHIDLREFMADWINKKEVTEQTPEEVEWSASSDEGEFFNKNVKDDNKGIFKHEKKNKEQKKHKMVEKPHKMQKKRNELSR